MKIKDLQKAKEFLENRIDLDNNLLDTIQEIKRDEVNLLEEIRIYKLILKVILKELRKEYKAGGNK